MHWYMRMVYEDVVLHTENSLIASDVLPLCHFIMITLASLLISRQGKQYPCALRFPSAWNNSASECMVSSVTSLNSLHIQYFPNEVHLDHCIYYFNLLSYLHSLKLSILFFPMTCHLLAYYKIYLSN